MTKYLGTSNTRMGGEIPRESFRGNGAGHPPYQIQKLGPGPWTMEWFPSQSEARAWIIEKGRGGVLMSQDTESGENIILEEILPGAG